MPLSSSRRSLPSCSTSDGRDDALVDELLGVDLADRRVLLDLRRLLGLGVGGLVGLVVAVAAVADQVDDDVAGELGPVCHRQPDRGDAALRIVGVDVDDRDVEPLRHVGGVRGRATLLRVGREAHLVVLNDVDRAAGLVALERLQVERLGDDSLSGERRVAVQQQRDRDLRVVVHLRAGVLGLGGAGAAGDDRIDELEVRGVRVEAHPHVALGRLEQPFGAVVVLDVAGAAVAKCVGPLDGVERLGALELGHDRFDRAAEVVREDREAAAVGHADHDLLAAFLAGEGGDLVDHRDGRVESLDREHLLSEVGLLEEALELVDLDQPDQQVALLLVPERLAMRPRLDHLPQPDALLMRGEVLHLVGDRAAVGVAHPRQRVEQGLPGNPDPQDRCRDLAHQLRGQVQVLRLERRVSLAVPAERVQRRREVTVGPVRLEQGGRGLDGLQQLLVGRPRDGRRRGGRRRSDGERRRGGGGGVGVRDDARLDSEGRRDALVEVVLTGEELVDPAQERAGLGTLDDPVVVGRRHRHDLRHAERLQPVRGRLRPLRRIGDRAGGDDRALPAHQARHRGDGPEPTGVGQRDVRALEVVGGQGVLARLADQFLVVGVEGLEVGLVGGPDARDHQAPGAVLLLDVDRDAEVDDAVVDDVGLAVDLGEGARHRAPFLGGFDDRPGDQVGERDLHALFGEGAVQRLPLGIESVDRERPERGRRRDRATLFHRLGEHAGRAAKDLGLARGNAGRTRICRCRRRPWRRGRPPS